MRMFMWQLETQLFVSSYIWLAYTFQVSYRTVVKSVSEKSSVDQSELGGEIGGVSLSDVLYVIISKVCEFCFIYKVQ